MKDIIITAILSFITGGTIIYNAAKQVDIEIINCKKQNDFYEQELKKDLELFKRLNK